MALAPLQSRLVAMNLIQTRSIGSRTRSLEIGFELTVDHLRNKLAMSIPLVSKSTRTAARDGFLSTFASNTVSYAVYTPPVSSEPSSAILVVLHGAGVDPKASPFWTQSVRRRHREWIVWPVGLTPWGFDWHGPSLKVRMTIR